MLQPGEGLARWAGPAVEVSVGTQHWVESGFQEGWPGVVGVRLRCELACALYPHPTLSHTSIKQSLPDPGGSPVARVPRLQKWGWM